MLTTATVLLALLGAVLCRPPTITQFGNFSNDPLSPEDRAMLRSLPTYRAAYPAGFKVMYVSQTGNMVQGSRPGGAYVKVVASPASSQAATDRVAQEIYKMLRLAPAHIFTNLANAGAGVGVFTAAEKLTVFPDYARLRDRPECYGRCDGACSNTCTFDGRKWDETSGAGGALAVVLEANVMCSGSDPYRRHDNIAVHEFAHTVDTYGLTATESQMLEAAYSNARAQSLWRTNAYGMANSAEYFAEATGAFFLVNLQHSPGGMNECYGQSLCRSEMEARYHIYQQDTQLYNLLVWVYTNNRGTEPGGLSVCP